MERHVYLVGERYKNNANCWYTITGYPDDTRRRYIEFDSGYKCNSLVGQLNNGKVRDLGEITYYGVACLGIKDGTNHPLYWRWFNMIGRCYNKSHCGYKYYGDNGVTVSEELLNFKNYIDIVENLDNYDELIKNPKMWDIDKDINGDLIEQKIYSKNTLKIIKKSENLEYEFKDKKVKTEMYDQDMRHVATFCSISDASKIVKLDKLNLSRAINTKKMYGGYYWRNANAKQL